MAEDVVEVEEEEEVLEEADMVDMMGMVAMEIMKMRGTGIGVKVAGVEEVGIIMEQAMKEAEAVEAMVAEATAVPGEGWVAVEGETWSSKRSAHSEMHACYLLQKKRIQRFSAHKLAEVLSQGFMCKVLIVLLSFQCESLVSLFLFACFQWLL